MSDVRQEIVAFIKKNFGDVVTDQDMQLLDLPNGLELLKQRVTMRVKEGRRRLAESA